MLEHLDTLIAFSVVMAVVSLMITTLTQMLSAVLGLRGTVLLDGLGDLLKTAHPDLAKDAGPLANQILRHPLISSSMMMGPKMDAWMKGMPAMARNMVSRWQLATAIHPEELVSALQVIANDDSPANARMREAAKTILARVDPEASSKIAALASRVAKIENLNLLADQGAQHIRQIVETAQGAVGGFETWFDSAMDRTSQRFAIRMRAWTVVFSVLAALFMQLDTFRLLDQLSTDAELRAQLVSSAASLTEQANEILGRTGDSAPSAYTDAMKEMAPQFPKSEALLDPPRFSTREDAEVWLRGQIPAEQKPETVVLEYRRLVTEKLKHTIYQLGEQANGLRARMEQTRLRIVPDPYPDFKTFIAGMAPFSRHFWGIVISAALLSLGAPFWFNMLKRLASLRPIVAAKQDSQKASA